MFWCCRKAIVREQVSWLLNQWRHISFFSESKCKLQLANNWHLWLHLMQMWSHAYIIREIGKPKAKTKQTETKSTPICNVYFFFVNKIYEATLAKQLQRNQCCLAHIYRYEEKPPRNVLVSMCEKWLSPCETTTCHNRNTHQQGVLCIWASQEKLMTLSQIKFPHRSILVPYPAKPTKSVRLKRTNHIRVILFSLNKWQNASGLLVRPRLWPSCFHWLGVSTSHVVGLP